MKNHDLPCSYNEESNRKVAIRIVFKSDSEEILHQEVALLMSVLDEVISDMMMLLAEAEASNEESLDISSPS